MDKDFIASGSPLRVLRENVVFSLCYRVAREPTLGVVSLRRPVSQGARRVHIGCGVIHKHGISPSAAVCESLAVLYHEVEVIHGTRHPYVIGGIRTLFWFPLDLRHLGAIGDELAVAG